MRVLVTYLVRDGVAIIEISQPPSNALTPDLRRELKSTLDRARADASVSALVVRARGRVFGSVVDPGVIEPDHESADTPSLRRICRTLEAFPKPVVAAVHGLAVGPAADLALACHFRVAQAGARIGFPDIRLGLIPAGGGALRLPHLVGAEKALEMLLNSQLLHGNTALNTGLIDRLVRDKAGVAAFAFARELRPEDAGPRRTRKSDDWESRPRKWLNAVEDARRKLRDHPIPAVRELPQVVEAALILPPREASAFDGTASAMVRNSHEAKALCRLSRAERKASLLPQRLGAEPRPVETVGILGDENAGVEIAAACLNSDYRVVFATDDEVNLESAYAKLGEAFDSRVARGALSEEEADDRLDRLTMVCGYQAFGAADILIDSRAVENEEAVAAARLIDPVAQASAVYASVSPNVDLIELARETGRPSSVLGLRISDAGGSVTGAEIVAATNTSRHAIATLHRFLRKLGRLPVLSFDATLGQGIAASISSAVQTAAEALVSEGADPADVSRALSDWGALDSNFRARSSEATVPSQEIAVAEGSAAVALPPNGQNFRNATPESIRRLCLAAAVNEGARLVSEKIALAASDIDVLAVHSLGFRRHTGGPMTEGDLAGLLSLRRALPRLGDWGGIGGPPHPLLDDLIKNGRGFESFDTD